MIAVPGSGGVTAKLSGATASGIAAASFSRAQSSRAQSECRNSTWRRQPDPHRVLRHLTVPAIVAAVLAKQHVQRTGLPQSIGTAVVKACARSQHDVLCGSMCQCNACRCWFAPWLLYPVAIAAARLIHAGPRVRSPAASGSSAAIGARTASSNAQPATTLAILPSFESIIT